MTSRLRRANESPLLVGKWLNGDNRPCARIIPRFALDMITYSELADQVDTTVEWLSGMGINPSRVQRHRDNNRMLADAQRSNQIDQLRKTLGPEKSREIFWSWVESFEIVEVCRSLQNVDRRELLPVLRLAVEGPTDAFAESALNNSNASRNFVFELVIAAKLARAGLEPHIGEPDVAADFQGYRLLIQCKRPFSTARVHENIIKAGSQLRRDLKKLPDTKIGIGLVAISISKILNQGDKIFEVPSRNDLRDALGGEIDDFWNKHKDSFINLSADRIAGALIHLSTPTAITSARTFLAAGMTSIHCFRGAQGIGDVLRVLEKQMGASW